MVASPPWSPWWRSAPTTGHHEVMPSEYMSVSGDASGVEASWDQLDRTMTDDVFRHVDLGALPGAG